MQMFDKQHTYKQCWGSGPFCRILNSESLQPDPDPDPALVMYIYKYDIVSKKMFLTIFSKNCHAIDPTWKFLLYIM
jgi:hypothetical protein